MNKLQILSTRWTSHKFSADKLMSQKYELTVPRTTPPAEHVASCNPCILGANLMSMTDVRESTRPARLIHVLWMPRPESLTAERRDRWDKATSEVLFFFFILIIVQGRPRKKCQLLMSNWLIHFFFLFLLTVHIGRPRALYIRKWRIKKEMSNDNEELIYILLYST